MLFDKKGNMDFNFFSVYTYTIKWYDFSFLLFWFKVTDLIAHCCIKK